MDISAALIPQLMHPPVNVVMLWTLSPADRPKRATDITIVNNMIQFFNTGQMTEVTGARPGY